MNRRKFLVAPLAALLLPGCSQEVSQNSLFAQYLTDVVKEDPPPKKAIVVVHPGTKPLDAFFRWREPAQLQEDLPEIQLSTAAALLKAGAADAQPILLSRAQLPDLVEIIHATESQLNKLDSEDSTPGFWNLFYRTFPDSTGLMGFSNVGFNASKDQAAFVVSHACGGLCGSGRLVLMSRRGSLWHTEKTKRLWSS
ncbi:hypothetical protein [Viridibacterium curvum]|uniref:Lipoprotein n=1 Tax=Viridibacterium curvum TaxID=1101404 RepID=A0ABP9QJF7_9RHOO